MLPPSSTYFTSPPLLRPHIFGWFLCVKYCLAAVYGHDVIHFCYFFVAHFDGPNNRIKPHPTLIAQLPAALTFKPLLLPTFD
jgi:hypothetical protein